MKPARLFCFLLHDATAVGADGGGILGHECDLVFLAQPELRPANRVTQERAGTHTSGARDKSQLADEQLPNGVEGPVPKLRGK
jgi:hypothetical protein